MQKEFDLSVHVDEPKLTAEYVLNNVDDVLIFRHYVGEFELRKPIKSPFGHGTRANFSILFNPTWCKLMFKDHHSGDSGDCFKFISKKFGITYQEAIEKVACDFGLTKGCSVITKKQLEEARTFKENFRKTELVIQVDIRKMNDLELKYWAQYGITKQDLIRNHIYAIQDLWINKKKIYLKDELVFAYHFPKPDKFKIYSPLNKDFKWFGNVSAFEIEGLENPVDLEKPILITKSRKDRIILTKLYSNTYSCQNEAETAIPKELDVQLDKHPSKFCWFDSDEPGKTANRKLNHRGYKWINVPNELYEKHGLKDPSDVIKFYGVEEGQKILINELKKKGII